MATSRPAGSETVAAGRFRTTHWTMVLAAGGAASPEASSALESLCRAYWYPLYAYIRRRGYSAEDAQDLTQGFFAQLFETASARRIGAGASFAPSCSRRSTTFSPTSGNWAIVKSEAEVSQRFRSTL